MKSLAVVVGGSGGIGRALLQEIDERQSHSALVALSRKAPLDWRGDHISFDLLNEDSIAKGAQALASLGTPTLVIVATGVLHDTSLQPEKTYRALTQESLQKLFAINAIGPALIAKHILPLLPRDRRSVFAALSARVGSIGDNRAGGWYGYRSSKAALNMMVKTLAIEHRRTHPLGICVALHPGTVGTALSAPFAGARQTLTPAQSAVALLSVLDSLQPHQSGEFFAWDGAPVAW